MISPSMRIRSHPKYGCLLHVMRYDYYSHISLQLHDQIPRFYAVEIGSSADVVLIKEQDFGLDKQVRVQ